MRVRLRRCIVSLGSRWVRCSHPDSDSDSDSALRARGRCAACAYHRPGILHPSSIDRQSTQRQAAVWTGRFHVRHMDSAQDLENTLALRPRSLQFSDDSERIAMVMFLSGEKDTDTDLRFCVFSMDDSCFGLIIMRPSPFQSACPYHRCSVARFLYGTQATGKFQGDRAWAKHAYPITERPQRQRSFRTDVHSL